ncbi:MAG: hypothetical protein IPP66_17250 [Anaerolineales bacterium]|nr:hypothetical protein [Anaerolineales bacterium]
MLSAIRKFFTAPVYNGDPEKTLDAKITHRVSVALLGLAILSFPLILVGTSQQNREYGVISSSLSIAIWLFTILLVKLEKRTVAKIIILTVNTASIYFSIFTSGGLAQPTIFAMLFLLAAAHLFFPSKGAIVYGAIILALTSLLYGLHIIGVVQETQSTNIVQGIFLTFAFTLIASATILAISSSNYQANIKAVLERENELYERNIELDQLRGALEQRVSERTIQLEKRANQFEAISTVASSVASLKNMDELLPAIARLVIESFGFYHTGIFLLDNSKEFAILVASPTEAGKQMIANGHKLRVGEVGIVGRVASSGEPRVTLDTGLDAVHFNNPLLPNTRSEMALPSK